MILIHQTLFRCLPVIGLGLGLLTITSGLALAQVDSSEQDRLAIETATSSPNDALATSTTDNITVPEQVVVSSNDARVPTDSYRRQDLSSEEVFGDFVVGPGRFEVEVTPGESVTVELIISNRMGEGRLFTFDIEDATGSASGESSISLLGDVEGPYSLRDFIQIPHNSFYLEHATRVRVPVTIALPPDAEPGGRYGSILTSVTSLPADIEDGTGAQQAAAVVTRIGTLFFVTTPGEIERSSALRSFSTRNDQLLYSAGPIVFNTVIENTGSVHTTPSGVLRITNLLGEEVGVVEVSRWFVMPQSLRNRELTWDRELLFGRYTATLELDLGYDEQTVTQATVFWVIPLKFVLVVFVSFLILFILFRFIFSRFEFKRKV